jgi:hypothetical protein
MLLHEPMEWKSARADNGDKETVTELPKARPASTSHERGLSHTNAPAENRAGAVLSSKHKPKGKRGASVQILKQRRGMELHDIDFVLNVEVLTIFRLEP